MDKDNQIIMTVRRDVLFYFDRDYFKGYCGKSVDFESRILSNTEWMRRGDAEVDPSHKQPIGYCLVINPDLKKVFAYKRESKDQNYHEKRLQGKWSWGVGGHIEQKDLKGNPLRESMRRELEEEIEMDGKIYAILPFGYINDDSDDVGKVHFGIVYAALTDSKAVKPSQDHENEKGELINLNQLEEILSSPENIVETWSKIAMPSLIKYL